MTDQPTPEGTGTPSAETPSAEPPPLAPLVEAAAPPPMPAAAPMPQAAPPPAVAWQAPPAAAPVKGQRTVLALVAGILLLLLAIGGGLLGLLVVVLGGTFISNLSSLGDIGNIPGYNGDPAALVGGFFAFFGVLVIAYSVAYLLAGIGVIRNSNWARVLGIVVGIISGLIWLSGASGAGQSDVTGAAGASLFSIVMLGIHAYIVVALLFFWRSKPGAA